MNGRKFTARRLILPATVFAAVIVIHFVWIGFFPEMNAVQSRWVDVRHAESWLQRYLKTQSYWLGMSYGMSLAFAAFAFRGYREGRFCNARNFALGSVTFSGVLSVAGCYLLGCCGSPMLAVYLNLFGTAFIPLAKPIVAGITFLTVSMAWWWMNRRFKIGNASAVCGDQSCVCISTEKPYKAIANPTGLQRPHGLRPPR